MVRQPLWMDNTAWHGTLLLLSEDLWSKATLLHLPLLLLQLGHPDLLFFPDHLLLDASLLLVNVHLGLVLLLVLVHHHIFFRNH